MFKFLASLTATTLSSIASAMAHSSALAHTHPHEPASLFSPQTIVAMGLGLAFAAAFAFVRMGRGK